MTCPVLPRLALAAAGLTALLALGACGKQGELERPAPLWGAKAKADYEAEQRAIAAAKAAGETANPAVPARTAPVPGTNPGPDASAPQGVLPDPFARPQ